MSFLKSSYNIKKRLTFAVLAIALIGGGVVSLCAQSSKNQSIEIGGTAAVSPVGDHFAMAKQQVTPENLKLMLLRIGLLYGAFICVLGALETGRESSDFRP